MSEESKIESLEEDNSHIIDIGDDSELESKVIANEDEEVSSLIW